RTCDNNTRVMLQLKPGYARFQRETHGMTSQDLTIFKAALHGMKHAEARSKVLASNIANADTAEYQAKDIKPLDFKAVLKNSSSSTSLSAATTNAGHIALGGKNGASGKFIAREQKDSYEVSPAGNSVVLEEQLMK